METKTDKTRQPKTTRLLNQRQAAQLLGISPRTLARRIARGGDLEAIRVGSIGHYIFSEARILELVGAVEKVKRKGR